MTLTIQLSSQDLTFLLHILEASEGIATLKTIDGKKGIAQLIYPASNQLAIEELLANFSLTHSITRLNNYIS